MGRALVVGCGYVGSAFAEELVDDGWEVWGLRRSPGRLPHGVRPLEADVTRPASLRACDLPGAPDLLVYAVSADEGSADAYRDAYVQGLQNTLAAVEREGGPPGRTLFVSSTAVYGQSDGTWVDEESPTEPRDFRGRILLEAESVAQEAGPDAGVLRLGGIYGPTRTRLVDRVRSGEARCPADPPRYSNRIHRDDAAGILRHLARSESAAGVYLGVDEEPAPICRVLRWIAREIGAAEPLRTEEGNGGRRRRSNKRCSSRKIRDAGYAFRYPTFREGYGELLE